MNKSHVKYSVKLATLVTQNKRTIVK